MIALPKWTRNLPRLLRKLVPLMALPLIGLVYFLGVRSERTGFVREVLDPGLKRITQPVLNAFRGKPPTLPLLDIHLEEADMDSLVLLRERSLDEGRVEADGKPRFTAKAMVDKREQAATLSLRDGPVDRAHGDRWSLHLRLSTSDTALGMRTFELTPVTGEGQPHAWLLQHALAAQGLPALGHAFADVRLNGRDLGLYALEERVDSTALARWGRGPGPVARFDEGLLANAREAMAQRPFPSGLPPQGEWLSAPIMASRPAQVAGDPAMAAGYQRAVRLLDGFRAGRLTASEVFDVPAMARLLALCDVLGGQEAAAWWNLRFLADSASGRLVAFPQRGFCGTPVHAVQAMCTTAPIRFRTGGDDLLGRLFGDSLLYTNYIAHLDTFSTEGWMDGLWERIGPEMELRERIVTGEFPQAGLDRSIFGHNALVARQTLRPKDLVLAYTQVRPEGRRRLAAANTHALPVVATAFISGQDTIPLARGTVLWPRERGKPLTYAILALPGPPDGTPPSRLVVRVLGLNEKRSVPVRTWSTFSAN